jgi:O-antigen/teichoic acid export membrane protein
VKDNLLKNGLYNVLGGITRVGLGIITIPILVNRLGTEEYGLWALSFAIISIFILAEAGLSTATTVFVSQDLKDENQYDLIQTLTVTLTAMIIMAILATSCLWLGANQIATLFPNLQNAQEITIAQSFRVGAFAVFSRLIQQVLIGIEQAYQRYDIVNFANAGQSLITSAGLILITLTNGKTIELMQWHTISSILLLLAHIWTVKYLLRNIHVSFLWNSQKAVTVIKYSSMMWMTSLGCALFSRVDRLIVGGVMSTEVLGVYAAITEVTSQINNISALPVQPIVPLLSAFESKQNNQTLNLKKQIEESFNTNSLFAFGLGTALITLTPLCLSFLFPSSKVESYSFAFSLCCAIYTIYSTNAVGYYILIGTKEIKKCTIIVSLSGILSILLVALGTNKFGLVGAIAGNAGYILTLLLSIVALEKTKIPLSILKNSLFLPTLFLLFVLALSLVLDTSSLVRIIVCIFQSGTILYVFFKGKSLNKKSNIKT